MKIVINSLGDLCFERGGRLKYQYCPFNEDHSYNCGDWCPLFQEPKLVKSTLNADEVILRICKNTFYIKASDFKDERKGKK